MENNQYYYAVTRIHSNEAYLLTGQALERMRGAENFSACVNILKEYGWTAEDGMRVKEIIEARQEKTWALLNELTGSSNLLDIFRYEHDFGNLKVLLKLHYSQRIHEFGERYISGYGTLTVQELKDLALTGGFDKLPELFCAPTLEANRLLLHTGSGQLSDAVLDRACIEAMCEEAENQDSEILKGYVEMKADTANIMIALRGLKMNKTADFYSIALTEEGSLSKQELCSAVSKGIDAVYGYISATKYGVFADSLKKSLSFFQAEVESRLIQSIKPQRHAIGGADPIFAFVIAKENELNVVRLVLSSKINQFPAEFVSGCLRRTYA